MSDIDDQGYVDDEHDGYRDEDEDYDEGRHSPLVDEDQDEDEAPELHYPDVGAFVSASLATTYRREVDGRERTWCPRWWAHAEAVVRLEALWRAWEHLRLEPALGMSIWLRDHADPHMAVLMDPAGPFAGCTTARGHAVEPLAPLPLEPAPKGFFDVE